MTPGPISDSFDIEFGTSGKAQDIHEALMEMYDKLTALLGHREPMDIRVLVYADLSQQISAALTEREWRLLRFALERAAASI